jgi:hypothetical protein
MTLSRDDLFVNSPSNRIDKPLIANVELNMTIGIEQETLAVLAEKYNVADYPGNDIFKYKSAILQSMWRDEHGYDMGLQNEHYSGTLLKMPWAEKTLSNFLTCEIRSLLETELNGDRSGKYDIPALYYDLMNSQALCFNLFAHLKNDPDLAGSVFSKLLPERIARITAIDFRYEAQPLTEHLSVDPVVFDVFITYESTEGFDGFLAFEVNYLGKTRMAKDPIPVPEDIRLMDCLLDAGNTELMKAPLSQILIKHYAADSMTFYDSFDEGLFIYLYPRDNQNCARTAERYRKQLKHQNSFQAWTLEHFHHILKCSSVDDWVAMLYDRYLDFDKVLKAL